jgi:NIMA (never in mitosis gene a)-related kinase
LNEVRLIASVDNPYIVSFKEAFIDDKSRYLYIVMEFAAQGDLLKKI